MGLFKKEYESIPDDCIRAFKFKTGNYLFFDKYFITDEHEKIVYEDITFIDSPMRIATYGNAKYHIVLKNGRIHKIEQCDEMLYYLYSRCPSARIG